MAAHSSGRRRGADGFVATIRLERERKLNAMTPEMAQRLAAIVDELNRADDCRVVILTGGAKVFCAGSDIHSLDRYPRPWDFRVRENDYTRSVRRLRKPTIAMISGYCLGGGLEMAVQADIRYADTTARFGAPEVTWGWLGGGGNSQLLPRLIGVGRTMELMLTGRTIDADEAREIGLVEAVYPPESLAEATYALARTIADNPPLATQAVKQAVRMATNLGVDAGLEYENELVCVTFATEDKAEGVRAFREKRRPRFTGR
jgi:enoyl-CoA hydratase